MAISFSLPAVVYASVDYVCLCIRLHNAVQAKQKDKQMIVQLEKRLKAEQEARAVVEKQLAEEKKRKKMEEASAARAVALAAASRWDFTQKYCFNPVFCGIVFKK